MIRRFLLGFSLFLAACANSDFPFCCNPTGVSDVPYTTTYDSTVATGFSNFGGSLSYLRIVSQGDVQNLFNAANISQRTGTGEVSGFVVDFSSNPVQSVVLQATDLNGNPVGDLFYNSLGGIPDFSTTAGTDVSGGFTLLNAPPGEIFFTAIQGGRGNAEAYAFPNSAYLLNMSVLPVVPSTIGVTGEVVEYGYETLASSGLLNPVGLTGLTETVNSSGIFRFPVLGSDSTFLIAATGTGYLPTYTPTDSQLANIPTGAIDVTQKLFVFSQSHLATLLSLTRYPAQDPAKGILVGAARDTDTSFQVNPFVLLTDDQGNSLNFNGATPRIYYSGYYTDPVSGLGYPTYFYFDATHNLFFYDINGVLHSYNHYDSNGVYITCANNNDSCPPQSFGQLDGSYVAFDLPPGRVHVSATAAVISESGLDLYGGGETVDIFPGGVTVVDTTMNEMVSGATDYYQLFAATVTAQDGVTPVGSASIFALGNALTATTADPVGHIVIPESADLLIDQATYTFKVSKPPSYVDTYQDLTMSTSLKNLELFPASIISLYLSAAGLSSILDPTKGILTGLVVDNTTTVGTQGITLQATDVSGNPVGDTRYFDSTGLPTLTTGSSKNGGYILFNLPPGLVQVRVVSPDDSGNTLVHIYPGGVTLSNIPVNFSPPATIQVSGNTSDLDGTPVGGVQYSILGIPATFNSDGSGKFSNPFAPVSQFKVKANNGQAGGIDTYNLFQTQSSDIQGLAFQAISAGKLQAAGVSAGVTVDPALGVLGGLVTTEGFSSSVPITGFSFSPMTDRAPHKLTGGLFNFDNEPDLAAVNSVDNTLSILLGGGDGTFRQASSSPICLPSGAVLLAGQNCTTSAQPVAVRSADLNGDGFVDLVVANMGADSVTVLLGNREGNFSSAPNSPLLLPAGSHPIDLTLADFNNDGFIDIVVLNSGNNTFSVFLGNGNGTFATPPVTYNSGGLSPSAILNSDFNGDGNLDLAIVNTGSNTVAIFLGYGTGSFVLAPKSPLFAGQTPVSITEGDINGDGFADLVVANQGSKSISIFLGNGTGLFSLDNCQALPVPSFCILNGPPEFVSLLDVNFDGRLDLIASSLSGDISLLTGLGNGTFVPEIRYSAGGNPGNLIFGDFNDDTLIDIVALQSATGTLALLPGLNVPASNVTVQANDINGNPAGQVRYYQSGSTYPVSSASSTDASGRFLIFNVPPGLNNVFASAGASGNVFMSAYAGSATFGSIPVIPPIFSQVLFTGTSIDPVGDQVERFVPGVTISSLGTANTVLSDPTTGQFQVNVNSNNFLLFKLQK